MMSEILLCARLAATARYRADELAHGNRSGSTVDHRQTINQDLLLEDHRSKNVVL
jgi:hypothetical protein